MLYIYIFTACSMYIILYIITVYYSISQHILETPNQIWMQIFLPVILLSTIFLTGLTRASFSRFSGNYHPKVVTSRVCHHHLSSCFQPATGFPIHRDDDSPQYRKGSIIIHSILHIMITFKPILIINTI